MSRDDSISNYELRITDYLINISNFIQSIKLLCPEDI